MEINHWQIPIVRVGNKSLQVSIDTKIYAIDAITSTVYKYTNDFYIHQQTDNSNDSLINVIFESKNEDIVLDEHIIKKFCNDLIDQQVRFITNKEFGHIRDLIVEEAFKPVNK